MTLEEKNQILYAALQEVCYVFRQNPPVSLDWFTEDMRRMQILHGGTARDPQGQEWMAYFVQQAAEKFGKEI